LTENSFTALDKSTFEILFKEHFRSLVFYAQRYVKDFDTAREITQEAFIALWEKRESIDRDRTVRAYLSSSIHNKCLNHLRENKKFDRSLLTYEKLSLEPADVTDAMVSNEIRTAIEAAIEELPEKCREVFRLSRFEHMKYQEIAGHLGISVKTVEAQMSKALLHMKNRLAGYFELLLIIWYFYLN
jgi:RNA polymerase sigma-70 factor (ECF subfamily)